MAVIRGRVARAARRSCYPQPNAVPNTLRLRTLASTGPSLNTCTLEDAAHGRPLLLWLMAGVRADVRAAPERGVIGGKGLRPHGQQLGAAQAAATLCWRPTRYLRERRARRGRRERGGAGARHRDNRGDRSVRVFGHENAPRVRTGGSSLWVQTHLTAGARPEDSLVEAAQPAGGGGVARLRTRLLAQHGTGGSPFS